MKSEIDFDAPLLIIEDQESMYHLIQHKLKQDLPQLQTLVATTQAEAESILSDYPHISFCISDLALPDSPKGEVVPKLIEQGISTVVLTNTYKNEVRLQMYRLRVADYVVKDGNASVDYAIECVQKLLTNHTKKVWLLADYDSNYAHEIQKLMTVQRYQVKVFSNFQDLKLCLGNDHPDLLIIESAEKIRGTNPFTEIAMIRKIHPASELSILSLEAPENRGFAIKLLKYGVNDFLLFNPDPEELITRVRQNITNRESFKRIQTVSRTDGLTEIFNRNYFCELVEQQLRTTEQEERYPFFIMIDIDFFKAINDQHGHQTGDQAIQATTELMKKIYRTYAIGRFGGEEFSIFGYTKAIDPIYHLSEFFREEISAFSRKQLSLPFTVSIGITFVQDHQVTMDQLISQADQALYQAKSKGRNQVVLYTG
jgi:diguanylate cyclase (GGDEF)-like protein